MSLMQIISFMKSLLKVVGLDRKVQYFGTSCRLKKTYQPRFPIEALKINNNFLSTALASKRKLRRTYADLLDFNLAYGAKITILAQ